MLHIVAVGREISDSTQRVATKNMQHYHLDNYTLNIIQGEKSDSVLLNSKLSQLHSTRDADHQKLMEISSQLSETKNRLENYTRLEQLATETREEMKSLFPQVRTLSLARVSEAHRDTTATSQFVAAIISTDPKPQLTAADRKRLHDWLKARTKVDSLVIYE